MLVVKIKRNKRANLGTTKSKVLTLGALYFLFSGTFQIMSNNSVAGWSEGITTLLVIPVALLDTFFYWWIFLSLVRTITQLIYRKQPIKLEMYKKLFVTLVLSGLISGLIVVYQLYFFTFSLTCAIEIEVTDNENIRYIVLTSSVDERWETWWIWESFWHILYFLVLLVICVLWRPTENNTRYAYSELKEVEESNTTAPTFFSAFYEMTQRSGKTAQDEADCEDPTSSSSVPTSSVSTQQLKSDKLETFVSSSSSSFLSFLSCYSLTLTYNRKQKIVPNFTLEEDEDEGQTEASKMN